MGFAYSIKNQGAVYFVTFTVHQWADVFTKEIYIDELLNSQSLTTPQSFDYQMIVWIN